MSETLFAGFGKECITPDFDVCLSGYGDELRRHAQGVAMDIYSTAVAIGDGENTVVIITLDTISSARDTTVELREKVGEAVGISADRVYVTNIHSHATPRVVQDPNIPGALQFREFVFEKTIAAAKKAVSDMAPAALSLADKQVPGMTFVRHWIMKDGTYAGPNFGDLRKEFAGHATRADETMLLLKLTREGKQDILMVNWQAHATNAREFGYYNIGPDFVGILRSKLQGMSGCLVTYLPGCSGNQIPISYWKEEHHGLSWYQYGEKLADEALSLIPELKPVEGTKIKNTRLVYQARANHADEDKIEQAREVHKIFKEIGRPESNKLAWSYGFTSCYHAMSILGRPALGPTVPLDMSAFCIGDLAFAVTPTETPSTVSHYVRMCAPFEKTVMLCGNFTYIATYAAYEYGGYEASNTPYAQGVTEEAQQRLTEMLFKVKFQEA